MSSDRIALSPPDVGRKEVRAAARAIKSGWVAPVGPELEKFEAALAENASRTHAVALSSGTSALHLGLLSLGVRQGDYVICSTLTFVASANAISYVGAIPIFVDSDVETGNMSPALLLAALESARKAKRKVSCAVVVDFLGAIADFDRILPICAEFKVPVLSDAAESVGSSRGGRPAGSFGDASIYSFNGNKIVTTSSGGAILTDDESLASRARHLATQAREKTWFYEHFDLGYNYRMSNVLAAIGLAQFERLQTIVSKRREIRLKYRELFASVAGATVLGQADLEDNCWLTAVLVDPEWAGFSTWDLYSFLLERGIESRPLWKPMHLQPLYQSCESFVDGAAERLFLQGLALPSGSGMRRTDWSRIRDAILAFLRTKLTEEP